MGISVAVGEIKSLIVKPNEHANQAAASMNPELRAEARPAAINASHLGRQQLGPSLTRVLCGAHAASWALRGRLGLQEPGTCAQPRGSQRPSPHFPAAGGQAPSSQPPEYVSGRQRPCVSHLPSPKDLKRCRLLLSRSPPSRRGESCHLPVACPQQGIGTLPHPSRRD